ncbi:MAG: hypothetical protein JO334_03660 [Verrucomicrobia bacterium]|nr:hypothetical protein [Verrucomicrobiota bacterium]
MLDVDFWRVGLATPFNGTKPNGGEIVQAGEVIREGGQHQELIDKSPCHRAMPPLYAMPSIQIPYGTMIAKDFKGTVTENQGGIRHG